MFRLSLALGIVLCYNGIVEEDTFCDPAPGAGKLGPPGFPGRRKGVKDVAILYDKLFALLAERGLNAYTLKKEKVVGNATIEKLQKNEGNIDTRSIVRLCKFLQCQPGDIMEFVDDGAE